MEFLFNIHQFKTFLNLTFNFTVPPKMLILNQPHSRFSLQQWSNILVPKGTLNKAFTGTVFPRYEVPGYYIFSRKKLVL
jgi:hypothetical protein